MKEQRPPRPEAWQVKQYVAILQNPKTGVKFRVFKTGDEQYYLFCTLSPDGLDYGLHFPVAKSDLISRYRRALAHGWGNAS